MGWQDYAWDPSWTSGPVTVTWLGTAGFCIEADGQRLLLDPYLTRASLGTAAFGRLVTDPALIAPWTDRVVAIATGHTHFDHAMDVPALAALSGARVYGSTSAAALCRAAKIPESRVVDVQTRPLPWEDEVGPFRLRFVASQHSRFLLGRVPYPGDISDCDQVPTRTRAFRCGAVFRIEVRVLGRTIVHVGSADLIDDAAPPITCDLALACVAGWTSTREYPERLVRALAPNHVLLSHWDNFFRPAAGGARALPTMKLEKLTDRLSRAQGQDARIGALEIGAHLTI
ncbi:MAG: MBL fold metallo-hydrolase [Bradymonadia bacterium]|jgi:L-ascorbate metabolism protein UlaG (beta-lactamase superfamily)